MRLKNTNYIYEKNPKEFKMHEKLFEELSKAIPNGAIVSTWGSLSEDGIRAFPNIGRGMQ